MDLLNNREPNIEDRLLCGMWLISISSATSTQSGGSACFIGNEELNCHGKNYFIGVALCLYTAASVSVANSVAAQCKKMDVSTSSLMLVSGFSSVILSAISFFFLPNRLFSAPQSIPLI